MIKKKVVRNTKLPNKPMLEKLVMQAHDFQQEISMAIEMGWKLVFIDECMVTKRTLPTHDWSRKKENALIDLSKIDTDPIAIVGAVSREDGLELL